MYAETEELRKPVVTRMNDHDIHFFCDSTHVCKVYSLYNAMRTVFNSVQ